jgi:protocatechuate 3,4-dioxygenase beta subunit
MADHLRRMSEARRLVLRGLVGVSAAALAGTAARGQAQSRPATPACGADASTTPPLTEGPYFTPGSPERTSLVEPGMTGTRIVLGGFVLSRRCEPIVRALVDVWHADAGGGYDNAGYRLRGHQFTDGAGRYRFETVVPGLYPGRTRHFHAKVQAPHGPVLTTQLFFPGEPQNERDWIFRPDLLLDVADAGKGKEARFDFVVEV